MRRSTPSSDTTNFYYPDSRQRLKLIEENFDTAGSDEDMSEEEDNSSDRNRLSCFVGWEASDMSYEAMLEHLEFSVEHEEMRKEPDEQEILALPLGLPKIAVRCIEHEWSLFQYKQVKADVIINWLYKHKKREAEENKNRINLAQVNNIIYEYKKIKRARKRYERSWTCRDINRRNDTPSF